MNKPDITPGISSGYSFPAVYGSVGSVVHSAVRTINGLGAGVNVPLLLRQSAGENCSIAINADWSPRDSEPMKSYGHFVKNGDTVQLKCTVVEKTTTERPTIVFQSIGVNPPEVTNTVDWYIGIGSDPVGPPSVSLGISCGASTVSAPGSVTCTSTVSPAQGSPVAGGFWIITLPSGSMVQMGNCPTWESEGQNT
jgi:hypothetical protein